ncbi:latent-transforming growth factor beta-binding protein 4 [Aulostomus maculatus]
MRPLLLCVWTLWILTLEAQHPARPAREGRGEEPDQPHRRGGHTHSEEVRGTGAALRGGGAPRAPNRFRACGEKCCRSVASLPRIQRCTKREYRQDRHLLSDWSVLQDTSLLCLQDGRGLHGYRCTFSTAATSLPGWRLAATQPSSVPHGPSVPQPVPPAITDGKGESGGSRVRPSKSPQVGRRAERAEEVKSTAKDAQAKFSSRVDRGTEDTQTESHLEVTLRTNHEGRTSLNEGLRLPQCDSESTPQTLDSNSGTKFKPRLKTKSDTELIETQLMSSGPRLRGEDQVDVTRETRREEGPTKPEKKKEVKMGGARKQSLSLREAQAVLLRKTLGRRGDKMAALLMKHIEKEKKRLGAVTSSSSPVPATSVETSVKTLCTQTGQYTVHVTTPADADRKASNIFIGQDCVFLSDRGHELIDKQQPAQTAIIPTRNTASCTPGPQEGSPGPEAAQEGPPLPQAPQEGSPGPEAAQEGPPLPQAPQEGSPGPEAAQEGPPLPQAPKEGPLYLKPHRRVPLHLSRGLRDHEEQDFTSVVEKSHSDAEFSSEEKPRLLCFLSSFILVSPLPADGQTATGGGVERIQVMFTPTICKVRCSQGRCVNSCEQGNVTTLYSSSSSEVAAAVGRRDGPGFRVYLCPLLCKNGGVCLQKDRCLCPPTFTGKFCQIPVAPAAVTAAAAASPSTSNEIVKPAVLSAMAANQELTQSEFLLPLRDQTQGVGRSGAPPSPSVVNVRVQHPPEASVKIHQVLKVSRFSPVLQSLSPGTQSGSAGAPAPAVRGIQAQTVRGDGTYTQNSGFKYCFREVKDGQCSSPLPGLRSRDMCCRGIGKAWGITDCVLCPANTGQGNSSCPAGFERSNGTQCVDVNECLQPGLCENGICVNTGGSYSCVCRQGFILDATHGLCISQTVISDEKGQCYRVLGSGQGPSSCSLPILKNITKQICCCSRVGKAWGPHCQRCPYFGSVAFKEICPAGPGYHYSASALQFNQRAAEQLGSRGAQLVTPGNQENQGPGSGSSSGGATRSQQSSSSSGVIAGGAISSQSSASAGTSSSLSRTSPPPPRPAARSTFFRPLQPGNTATTATRDRPPTPGRAAVQQNRTTSFATEPRPLPPSSTGQDSPTARENSQLSPAQPQSPELSSRPRGEFPPPQNRPAVTPTKRPAHVQPVQSVCEARPGVCGRGRCVDQPDGKHTCVCDQGYKPNSQRTYCQDVDECQQNPCSNARCENTPGSYRCVCRLGYRLTGSTCTDVDECEDPLQCPGQECINNQGSYRCVSCQPGYGLLNRLCTDIDECRQAPCNNGRCENTPGSFRCICRRGYKLQNSNTCTDVDECAEPSQCPAQMCVNSPGSYHCVSCQPGYTVTNRQCTDVNECEDSDVCARQECVNTEGSYRCVECQQGYQGVNGQCADVDECASAMACEAERVCVNTVGSFRCDCAPGYRSAGLGRQCRDVNECLEGDFCFSRGECVNTQGSYTCVCSQGFKLSDNGTACLDVDECLRSGVCSDGDCVNTEGSFQCRCRRGFTTNPERTACLDVDECVSSGGSVCGSQRCENTIGSYRCLTSCEPGYRVASSGECVDVDECVNKTACGAHAICQNLEGTFQCVCDRGFTSTADGKSCEDENECVSLLGVCGSARCENVEGSFMCECDRRGEEFDPATRRCVKTARQAETVAAAASASASASASSSSSSSASASSSRSSSPSVHVSLEESASVLPPLPSARPSELRECYYNLAERGTCSLLATNTSQQECCCTVGEGWGLGCQYHACPPPNTAEFLSLCPSGRGYVTTGAGAFSYTDVDECKRFHPEVCKSGVCVNNIPGYNCYCSSGYVYNSTLLECVDHDECEEESCVGGVCVNTVGSYYCSCQPPLVLDDTQRNCVNSSHLTLDENLSVCWQHVTADLVCQSPLLGALVTFMDCCCLYGEGWGMECALCPSSNSDDYASLCSSFPPPPLYPESFPDSTGPETGGGGGRGGGASPYGPPYGPDSFPAAVVPGRDFSHSDYEDYSPAGGSRSGFRGRTPATFGLPDGAYQGPEFGTGYYTPPDSAPPRPPSFRLPLDPRAERAFGARPPPPIRPEAPPLSLAPLPGGAYEEPEEDEEEETWRGPPFPPFTERRRGGGAPRRLYERRYESYAGLSVAEDCGILHGCENGRCIRVAEGYTCDCYQGYELDMTTMTCIDINECEDGTSLEFPCVNARCVNTDGSFRCVCRRGYIMSRRPNHCVAA